MPRVMPQVMRSDSVKFLSGRPVRTRGVVLPVVAVLLSVFALLLASGLGRQVLAARMSAASWEQALAEHEAEDTVARLRRDLDAGKLQGQPGYYDAPLPLGGSDIFWPENSPHSGSGPCIARYRWSWPDCAGQRRAAGRPIVQWVVERMPSDPSQAIIFYRITVRSAGPHASLALLQAHHRVVENVE